MKKHISVQDITTIGLFVAVISVCAWISIPVPALSTPVTLQIFGVFTAAAVLGLSRGTICVATYLLLGAVGAPVFSSFRGGVAHLIGPTGGYLVGFLFSVLVIGLILKYKNNLLFMFISMAIGLIVCYIFGTVWFLISMKMGFSIKAITTALLNCVVPFIIPDSIKIILSALISNKLKKLRKV